MLRFKTILRQKSRSIFQINKLLLAILIFLFIFLGTSKLSNVIVNAQGRPLSAYLKGTNEDPNGDVDGSGSAYLTVNFGQRTICFNIYATNITLPATAAHIHAGNSSTNGPIVISLLPPNESGNSEGCIHDVDTELIKAIRLTPDNYYINVHNADYPNGVIRGQLEK